MSRTKHPKQFIDVLGIGKTLIQQTYDRFTQLCLPENIFVVAHQSYKKLVQEQLPDLPPDNIICEPLRKNTAPCIAYASYKINLKDPKALVVVAPSDHLILKERTFLKARNACYEKAASEDCLLTIGIRPMRPDTGYGYIQFKESPVTEKDTRIKKVKTFTEKPDHDMAVSFIQSGDFLWNSGIFIWSVSSIIKALEQYLPEVADLFKEGQSVYNTPDEKKFIDKAYVHCKSVSIDYGVMERRRTFMSAVPLSAGLTWVHGARFTSIYPRIKRKMPL